MFSLYNICFHCTIIMLYNEMYNRKIGNFNLTSTSLQPCQRDFKLNQTKTNINEACFHRSFQSKKQFKLKDISTAITATTPYNLNQSKSIRIWPHFINNKIHHIYQTQHIIDQCQQHHNIHHTRITLYHPRLMQHSYLWKKK